MSGHIALIALGRELGGFPYFKDVKIINKDGKFLMIVEMSKEDWDSESLSISRAVAGAIHFYELFLELPKFAIVNKYTEESESELEARIDVALRETWTE